MASPSPVAGKRRACDGLDSDVSAKRSRPEPEPTDEAKLLAMLPDDPSQDHVEDDQEEEDHAREDSLPTFDGCVDEGMRQQLIAFVRQKRARAPESAKAVELLFVFGDLDASCGRVGTLSSLCQLSRPTAAAADVAAAAITTRCVLEIAARTTHPSTWAHLVLAHLTRARRDEELWIAIDLRGVEPSELSEWMAPVRHFMLRKEILSPTSGAPFCSLAPERAVQVVLMCSASSTNPAPPPVTEINGLSIRSIWPANKRAALQSQASERALVTILGLPKDAHLLVAAAWLCRPLLEAERAKAVQQLVEMFFAGGGAHPSMCDFLLWLWDHDEFSVHLPDLLRVLQDLNVTSGGCAWSLSDKGLPQCAVRRGDAGSADATPWPASLVTRVREILFGKLHEDEEEEKEAEEEEDATRVAEKLNKRIDQAIIRYVQTSPEAKEIEAALQHALQQLTLAKEATANAQAAAREAVARAERSEEVVSKLSSPDAVDSSAADPRVADEVRRIQQATLEKQREADQAATDAQRATQVISALAEPTYRDETQAKVVRDLAAKASRAHTEAKHAQSVAKKKLDEAEAAKLKEPALIEEVQQRAQRQAAAEAARAKEEATQATQVAGDAAARLAQQEAAHTAEMDSIRSKAGEYMKRAQERELASATRDELLALMAVVRKQQEQLASEQEELKAAKRKMSHKWSESAIQRLLDACRAAATDQASTLATALPTVEALNLEFDASRVQLDEGVKIDRQDLVQTAEQHLLRGKADGDRADTTRMCTLRNCGMRLILLKQHVWAEQKKANQAYNKTLEPSAPRRPTEFRAWVQVLVKVDGGKDKRGWNTQYISSLLALAEACVLCPQLIYLNMVVPDMTLSILHANLTAIKRALKPAAV